MECIFRPGISPDVLKTKHFPGEDFSGHPILVHGKRAMPPNTKLQFRPLMGRILKETLGIVHTCFIWITNQLYRHCRCTTLT